MVGGTSNDTEDPFLLRQIFTGWISPKIFHRTKIFKKLAAILAVIPMIFALMVSVHAVEGEGGATDPDTTPTETYSITIEKAGNLTIGAEQTFTAYKLLDIVSTSGEVHGYQVTEGFKSFVYPETVKDNEPQYNFDSDVNTNEFLNFIAGLDTNEKRDAFADTVENYVEASPNPIQGNVSTYNSEAQTQVISNLTPGYYIVIGQALNPKEQPIDTPARLIVVDVAGNENVKVKGDVPTADKYVGVSTDSEGTINYGKANQAGIGETINYKIDTKVPNVTGYLSYDFSIIDTIDPGLTITPNTLVVKVKGNEIDEEGNYSVATKTNEDESVTTTISFLNLVQKIEDNEWAIGDPIEVTYKATLNNKAVVNAIGNQNKAKVEYTNSTVEDGTGKSDSPESTVTTFTSEIDIHKVDPDGHFIGGAQFEITGENLKKVNIHTGYSYTQDPTGKYYKLVDGRYTDVAPTEQTKALYVSTETRYKLNFTTSPQTVDVQNGTYTVDVDSNGQAHLIGLPQGTYTIKEIKAPDGYNLLQQSITVEIGWTEAGGWTFKVNNEDRPGVNADGDSANDQSVVPVKVILKVTNFKGVELPETGGIGTTLFYVIGGLLVVGSGVMMALKLRKKA